MAATVDEEMNVVESAEGMDENMNNEEYAKGTGVRKKEYSESATSISIERKRKFFQQYFYQQDYHEALRSLLWEPYDCRNNRVDDEELDEEGDENWCLLAKKVPERKLSFSDTSTVSSCSSEGVTGGASALDKRISWPVTTRLGTPASRRTRPYSERLESGWSSGACDLDREQMDVMVSDLGGGGKDGAHALASCHQAALESNHPGRQSVRNRVRGGVCSTSLDMASFVPGTLEPPDASDSTRLVESSVLDGRAPSSGNVSVVNCYRAVPVAVVSSVPTIKCLNTQENVSNVNVVQTYVRPVRSPPSVPSTSKVRPKHRERPISVMVPRPPTNPDPVLTNHNRSVSNPVLGHHPRPSPSRFGSQQNLPIRLETHFGESLEHSHTFLTNQNRPPPPQEVNVIHSNPPNELPKPRTFTSTEAQTDDIGVPLNVPLRSVANREQRRRERRERRHQRRLHQSVIEGTWQTSVDEITGEVRGLPDLLHSHLPPPYLTGAPMPPPLPVHVPSPLPVPPVLPHLVDPGLGSPPHPPNVAFPFPFSGSSRR